MYVSDLGNDRILAFPLTSNKGSPNGITIVGRYGAGPSLNQIDSVYYMSVDRTSKLLYLSDSRNHRILKLNLTDNTITLAFGTGMPSAEQNSLNYPLGITVDEQNCSVYVVDSQNSRVIKFNSNSTESITVVGGTGIGSNLSQFNSPSGIEIDPSGNVYVADSGNHRIIQWLVDTKQGRIIAGKNYLCLNLSYP